MSDDSVEAYVRDRVSVLPEILDKDMTQAPGIVLAGLTASAAKVTEHADFYNLKPSRTVDSPNDDIVSHTTTSSRLWAGT
ncbi:hypothetical protein CWO91_25185 [Bradyrhizobium genosp. SA-3]|nr:hypothetical protein CWO91_25185 [Bradyrhizobium genosp. SA-3]